MASAVPLGLSPAGHEHYSDVFYTESERERKFGVGSGSGSVFFFRPRVSRPVCLLSGPYLGHMSNFISVAHLRSSCCGAPSLTRGLICIYNLLSLSAYRIWVILIANERVKKKKLSGSSPAELITTLYSLVWDSSNLGSQVPLFIHILQEQGGPVIPPGTGFPFCRLLRLAGLRWSYCNPPPYGCIYPRKRVAQLDPRKLGFLFVACYDSQGCGWSIITHLRRGQLGCSKQVKPSYVVHIMNTVI
jgi:hypothetical protein